MKGDPALGALASAPAMPVEGGAPGLRSVGASMSRAGAILGA